MASEDDYLFGQSCIPNNMLAFLMKGFLLSPNLNVVMLQSLALVITNVFSKAAKTATDRAKFGER